MIISKIKVFNVQHKIFSIKYYGILKQYIILRNGIIYGPYKYNELNLLLTERKFIHTDLMAYSNTNRWKKVYSFVCFDRRSKYNLKYIEKPLAIIQKNRIDDKLVRKKNSRALDSDRFNINWTSIAVFIAPFFLVMFFGFVELKNSFIQNMNNYQIATKKTLVKKLVTTNKNTKLKIERKIANVQIKKIKNNQLSNENFIIDDKFQVEDKYYEVYEDYFDDPFLEKL